MLYLALKHTLGWALLLLGKKFKFQAQFDDKEWVFWSILFLHNLRFDCFWDVQIQIHIMSVSACTLVSVPYAMGLFVNFLDQRI